MDSGPSDQQTTVHEASGLCVRHGVPLHGGPTGDSALPFLFTLYTNFSYNSVRCHLQTFSDNTTITGCVPEENELEHRKDIMDLLV